MISFAQIQHCYKRFIGVFGKKTNKLYTLKNFQIASLLASKLTQKASISLFYISKLPNLVD